MWKAGRYASKASKYTRTSVSHHNSKFRCYMSQRFICLPPTCCILAGKLPVAPWLMLLLPSDTAGPHDIIGHPEHGETQRVLCFLKAPLIIYCQPQR
jgi:hypothetical protein